MESQKSRPRRFGFTLACLLSITTLCGLLVAWAAAGLDKERRQRIAVEKLERVRGEVHYEQDLFVGGERPGFGLRNWLYARPFWDSRWWFGAVLGRDRQFVTVAGVRFLAEREMSDGEWEYFCSSFPWAWYIVVACPFREEQLRFLERMKYLGSVELDLTHLDRFTMGEGLGHLRSLPQLWALTLAGIRLNDAGKKALGKLESLRQLDMFHEADDDTLANLTSLKRLWHLGLSGEGVTDTGLSSIGKMSSISSLWLSHTGITDEGLRHLAGLKITDLWLGQTKVTDRGVVYLARLPELQTLRLDDTAVTDAAIPNLEKLKNLVQLGLRGTRVSGAGCKRLLTALPNLTIFEMPDGEWFTPKAVPRTSDKKTE